MKKYLKLIIFATLLFAALPLCARQGVDWAISDDYNDYIEYYALYKAIHGIPIKYTIRNNYSKNKKNQNVQAKKILSAASDANLQNLATSIEKEKKIAEEREETEKNPKNLIEQSFYIWFDDTLAMIEKDGRTKEFNDIKEILLNKIELQRVSKEEKKNISFFFLSEPEVKEVCGKDANGCFSSMSKSKIFINISCSHKDILAMTTHEIGHYFGLGDQYEDFDSNSLVYSTSNRIGNYDSVMAGDYEITLSCDDVDGFINLIDLTLALENNGKFSKRAKKGWASFCNGKKNKKGKEYEDVFYKNAKQLNKEAFTRGDNTYYYDENGNMESSENKDGTKNFYDRNGNKTKSVIEDKSNDKTETRYYNKNGKLKKTTIDDNGNVYTQKN